MFFTLNTTREEGQSCSDIEAGSSSSMVNESDDSLSDSGRQSWHSQYNDDDNGSEINGDEERRSDPSCLSNSSYEVDLEKCERVCRICHLSLAIPDSFVLGCLCKDDLGAAHKQCAYAWFKIKGNKTCEICGSTAKNLLTPVDAEVSGCPNENSRTTLTFASPIGTLSFWQGHGFLNFILTCIISTFVLFWLFHYNSIT